MKTLITTKRLLLRELVPEDKTALAAVLSDPESMKFYPEPFSDEKVAEWINKNIARYAEFGFGLWGVVLKENNLLIGDCGITYQQIDGETLPEIGYHIRPDYCGLGYATEAARACKEYAFYTLSFPEIYSYMYSGNTSSRRVAEKNGMTLVKTYLKDNSEVVVYQVKR
ncbi:MAG: GNAT family N-acetyltransferase [Firmicutes bacterium]|nr:GNAT family N-acetyltransferase [Bacillota bacterium]